MCTQPPHSFLSIIRRPPQSPLFPYTTLFRSIFFHIVARREREVVRQRQRLVERGASPALPDLDRFRCLARGPQTKRSRSGRDRKSTRLNSSHVEISYAVFCLKKKKIYHTRLL